jgi:hypothetical protein
VLRDEAILDLQAGRTGKRYVTGYHSIDERVSLSDEGQLIITTGGPGSWQERAPENPRGDVCRTLAGGR